MRKNMQEILPAVLICFLVLFGASRPAQSATLLPGPDAGITNAPGGQISNMSPLPEVGYLEDIAFEKIQGKERINLTVSKQPLIAIEDQDDAVVLLKLENMFVPEELRQPLGKDKLPNIITVSPTQRIFQGKQWIYLTIALREQVPYTIIQEAQRVLIDFNVISLAGVVPPQAEKPAIVGRKNAPLPPVDQKIQKIYSPEKAAPSEQEKNFYRDAGITPVYTGHRISLDFQDANIRSVFRLLAELSGTSIVSSPDVKGNITINMKNVPWDQALDTILSIQGLGKTQTGDVITVMSLEKIKKDEMDRQATEEDKWKTEDARKEREKKALIAKGKLRQISIEAKIVEVTSQFARALGVSWGYGYKDKWSGRDVGVMLSNSATGNLTSFPSGIGFTNSNLAVNFPSLTESLPAVGFIAGSSKFILDAKIEALEETGGGKIISLPKITTMDNVKAMIKQGQEIPIVTPGTANNPPTVTFKDAALKLEVKPTITAEGKISMEIKASNDSPNFDKIIPGNPNPPINTSMVESTVVIRDGDTIVIGGVLYTADSKTSSAVPWLSRIPILGWLFKNQVTKQEKRELMIFVTPTIIKENT